MGVQWSDAAKFPDLRQGSCRFACAVHVPDQSRRAAQIDDQRLVGRGAGYSRRASRSRRNQDVGVRLQEVDWRISRIDRSFDWWWACTLEISRWIKIGAASRSVSQ